LHVSPAQVWPAPAQVWPAIDGRPLPSPSGLTAPDRSTILSAALV
jgi:hypothetical protein